MWFKRKGPCTKPYPRNERKYMEDTAGSSTPSGGLMITITHRLPLRWALEDSEGVFSVMSQANGDILGGPLINLFPF